MKKFTLQLLVAVFAIFVSNTVLFGQNPSISYNSGNGCAPASITFNVTGTLANATTAKFNFNDGSSILIYPISNFPFSQNHTFSNTGNYNVSVDFYDPNNNYLTTSYANNLTVNGSSINSPDSACVNDMLNFCVNGQVNSASWNFGDGGTSNQQCTQHSFAGSGPQIVTVVVNSNSCPTVTLTKTIFVGTSVYPHPYINASTNQTCPGAPINFNTDSYSLYSWNFGNGTSTIQNPQNIYTTPGIKNIILTVTNGCGKTGTASSTVTISSTPPPFPNQSWFSLQPNSPTGCPNTYAGFNAPSGYNSYLWNFGDGTPTVSGPNSSISHQYGSNIQNYTVSVKITSQCGNDTTLYSNFAITNHAAWPQNGFNLQPSALVNCPNSNIGFQAPGGYNTYVWNFGDNSPLVTTQYNNNNHQYGSAIQNYTVSVKITSPCGNDTTLTSVIVVNNTTHFPNYQGFNLQVNSSPTCPNSNVNFNAPGGYNTYLWNFGDGTNLVTTTNNNTNHQYGSALGTRTVSVKITNGCGLDTTLTSVVVIQIMTLPFPNQSWFTLNPNSPSACPNSNVGFNAPGGYNSYQWNFGDNTPLVTTTNNYNNHTYGSSLQNYTVTVKITSPCGNDTTLSKVFSITNHAPFPNQNFGLYSNSPSCPNSQVGFNAPGGYNIYEWDFGDNSPHMITSNNNNNHLYGNAATYTASVKITSPCGNDTTISTQVVINTTAPFPNQSWFSLQSESSSACPGDMVGFQAPGGFSNYLWNFGDNTPLVTTTNNNNNHAYIGSGPNYTASVKITNGCGHDTTLTLVIHINNNSPFPNQNWFSLQGGPSPACPNSSVNINAPNGFASYLYNFGDGSPAVTSTNNGYNHTYGSALIDYNVTVKITNGCGHDTTLNGVIQIRNNVHFPNNQQDFQVNGGSGTSCPGDQVNLNAPYGYSSYKWKFGDGDSISSSQNNANHVYTISATYTYSVKITNACGNDTTLFGTVVVATTGGTFYSGLSINMSPNTGSCPNDLISFGLNQNGFHSYFWNFGGNDTITTTGENIQHSFSTVGTHNVSCTITNGCGAHYTITATAQVQNNSPVNSNLSITGVSNPSCPGDQVFFVTNGGQPTYKYYWNYGDGTPNDSTIGAGSSHVFTTAGNKTVTVTVKNACGITKTITYVQNVSTQPIYPSLVGQDGKPTFGYPGNDGNNNGATAGCAGDAIIFYFFGSYANNVWNFGDGNSGTATEHMVISGGNDGDPVPVTIIKHVFTTNGPYEVHLTVTNNCGNSVTDSLAINIGGNQVVNGSMTTSPAPFTTCAPINFLAFGGANYSWNFGDGTTLSSPSPTVSHTFATAGVKVVSVVVTNGCNNSATYSQSINVSGGGGPAVTLTGSTHPTCVNGNNGTATISVSGGQAPYTYLWNDGASQTTTTVNGLAAGLYNAIVTDNIGCSSTFAVSISNPSPIVLNTPVTNTGCGTSVGAVSVSVTSGGTSPFTYLWSTGATASNITGLHSGAYSVVVTDAHGCSASKNVGVSETGGATLATNAVTNASCHGSANGSITINVTGGTSPYTYLWSNNSTAQNPSGLVAGNYSVVVTDNGGCHGTLTATVAEPADIVLTLTTGHAPTCGNADGSAVVSATGGTGPYTYVWDSATIIFPNPSPQTTAIANTLPAGTYSVTVTDSKGCTKDGSVTLSNSNAPNITGTVTNVSCNGGSNGAVTIAVSGGTSPYSYTWNVPPPQTNHHNLTALSAGSYLIFLHDAQGCLSVRSYTVTEPAVLTASITNTGATCNNSDGTATVTTAGGNTTFTYLWTGAGSQTTSTAVALGLGAYSVAVTDNKGCTASASTTIATTTPTPSICMVTVDGGSVNNIVYWDKTPYTSVDSFIIYREVSTAIYKRIGAQPYSALSEFTDTARHVGPSNGDPNVSTYRYKLQLRDLCGNYSTMSAFHNTIYITDNNTGTFLWPTSYTIEDGANPVLNYNLTCDTANLNAWFNVGATTGTQNLVVDQNFSTHIHWPNAVWRVTTDWSISCDPTRAAVNTSRSNIRHPNFTTGISSAIFDETVKVYPNPAKDNVTIELSPLTKNAQLKITDVLGQTVYNEIISATSGKTVRQINTSNFAKGVYSISFETNTSKQIKKLVIN